jgi:hypothetical protein
MNREAHVRAARRRQALDALAFEQDRAAMLAEQLEDVLAEVEGTRLDADLFAKMSPDDAGLVRAAFGDDADADADGEGEPDGDDFVSSLDLEDDPAETGGGDPDDVEAEIVRLQAELESSRRAQAALEQYLELLSGQPVV